MMGGVVMVLTGGALTYQDLELAMQSLFACLQYDFYIGEDTFDLLDVVLCTGALWCIILAVKRLILFYCSGRR